MGERLYMHTINGEPGYFNGKQIVPVRGRTAVPLFRSRSQLVNEQRKSKVFRSTLINAHEINYGSLSAKIVEAQ